MTYPEFKAAVKRGEIRLDGLAVNANDKVRWPADRNCGQRGPFAADYAGTGIDPQAANSVSEYWQAMLSSISFTTT